MYIQTRKLKLGYSISNVKLKSVIFWKPIEVKILLYLTLLLFFIFIYNFDCSCHHVQAAENEKTEAIIVHYGNRIIQKIIFGATALGHS